MAIDELNTQAIVIGGKKIKFELAAEDERGRPASGDRRGTKTVRLQGGCVVGHLQSGTTFRLVNLQQVRSAPHHGGRNQPRRDQARLRHHFPPDCR